MVEIVVPFWVLPATWLVLFSGGLMSAALSWIWDRSHEPPDFRGFNLKEVGTLLDDVLDPVFDSFSSLSLSIVSLVLMVAGLFTCTPAVFLGAEFVAEEALISGTASQMAVSFWLVGIGLSLASTVSAVYYAHRPW